MGLGWFDWCPQQPTDFGDHAKGAHRRRELLSVHGAAGAVVEGKDLLGLVARYAATSGMMSIL